MLDESLTVEQRAISLRNLLDFDCNLYGLDLIVCENKIGLVDRKTKKIVELFHPSYTSTDLEKMKNEKEQQAEV